ncbi:MAG: Na+/H+ antiporter NhaA [Chitinophagaceae bacterium]|nr:Na+/H+ antiporter NhaA [Chitinophagaceae bacterium]
MVARIRYKILTPLRFFFNDSRATGVLLIVCTIISLILANTTSRGGWYSNFWNTKMAIFEGAHLPGSPLEWINNFFMSFFFVLAATEIKRELLTGELSSFKKAILPFGAAFGGMLFPALIFAVFNLHSHFSHGWGIPTATDIAFSLGAASLLGKRFPVGLKILLMALAIIDDLGAIVVIALFYGGHINWMFLGISSLLFLVLFACNYLKLRFGVFHVVLGLALWFTMLQSGIEASITGVLFAFAMPIDALAVIERAIHRQVNFIILPLFALANTAILFPDNIVQSIGTPVGMGILFGLVVGKPVGIFLVSRIMVGLKIADLPSNVKWKEILGMGALAGIGFTMSIFTTMLAFSESGARNTAKISILASVLISLGLSYVYFRAISITKNIQNVMIPTAAGERPAVQLNLS